MYNRSNFKYSQPEFDKLLIILYIFKNICTYIVVLFYKQFKDELQLIFLILQVFLSNSKDDYISNNLILQV